LLLSSKLNKANDSIYRTALYNLLVLYNSASKENSILLKVAVELATRSNFIF
jgi:hypothetical protein